MGIHWTHWVLVWELHVGGASKSVLEEGKYKLRSVGFPEKPVLIIDKVLCVIHSAKYLLNRPHVTPVVIIYPLNNSIMPQTVLRQTDLLLVYRRRHWGWGGLVLGQIANKYDEARIWARVLPTPASRLFDLSFYLAASRFPVTWVSLSDHWCLERSVAGLSQEGPCFFCWFWKFEHKWSGYRSRKHLRKDQEPLFHELGCQAGNAPEADTSTVGSPGE